MADEQVTAAPEVVQGNTPEARTATGEIKDQQTIETKPSTESAATEKKPEATLTTEKKDGEGEKKAEPGVAPDKYEFKPPEGQKLDDKLIESATPILKELGISQEGAQKLFDLVTSRDAAAAAASDKVMSDMRTDWRDKVVKDPALGDGKDNLRPEVRANTARALDALGVEAKSKFVEALDLTGAGDNPAVIAAMNAFGKLLGEGTLVAGGRPSPGGQTQPGKGDSRTPAQRMFPNLPSSASGS